MKTIELTDEEVRHLMRLCEDEAFYWETRNKFYSKSESEMAENKIRLSKSILEKL